MCVCVCVCVSVSIKSDRTRQTNRLQPARLAAFDAVGLTNDEHQACNLPEIPAAFSAYPTQLRIIRFVKRRVDESKEHGRRRRRRTVNGELGGSVDERDRVLGMTHVDACVRQTNSLQPQTSIRLDVNPVRAQIRTTTGCVNVSRYRNESRIKTRAPVLRHNYRPR